MTTVGLIVEYNPLHNGHAHHFAEAKRLAGADTVVAVMSGNFLQRGEPAIVDKWARAEMALALGVDLVLELPVAYALQPAEWFAYGAAALLDATGVVTHLCFGSEAGALETLQPLAERLADESADMKAAVAAELASGASYPAAYAAAAARTCAGAGLHAAAARELLMQPNNSLGLHYLIALRRLRSGIAPLTVRRYAAGYHDAAPQAAGIASATAVRSLLSGGGLTAAAPYVPPSTAEILAREFAAGRGPISWKSFAPQLFHQLLLASPQQLSGLYDMTEGLEYRIKQALPKLTSPSVEQLLNQVKTKRYTRTKLQRTLAHMLLQHDRSKLTESSLSAGPQYLRVLGFSDAGRELLRKMKKTARLPVLTRVAGNTGDQLELDLQAAAVYANSYSPRTAEGLLREYRQPPIHFAL